MEKTFDDALKEVAGNRFYNTVTNVSDIIYQLVEARIKQRVGYEDLAEQTGISARRLKKFDKAERIPSLIDLCSIATALGLEVKLCKRG